MRGHEYHYLTVAAVIFKVNNVTIMSSCESGAAVGTLSGLLDEFRSISSSIHNSETSLSKWKTHQDGIESLKHGNTLVDINHIDELSMYAGAAVNNNIAINSNCPLFSSVFDLSQDNLMNSQRPKVLESGCDSLYMKSSVPVEAGEIQLPPEYLQCDGQSLPSLATELVTAQSSQISEVQKRKAMLTSLQVELAKEEDRVRSVERDIISTMKDIYLSQDECSGYAQNCVSLEKRIGRLLENKLEIESKLNQAKEEYEGERKVFSLYKAKISRHIARTEEAESNLPIHKEVASLKDTIQRLKDQRCEYMQGDGLLILSGEKQHSLQKRTDEVLANIVTVETEESDLEKAVITIKDHNIQLRRELDMKKKRHNAQITRLQRQVSEAMSRKKQWEKEASQVRMSIRELKRRIEE